MIRLTWKRPLRLLLFVASALLALAALSFLPTFLLKTVGMNAIKGQYITVFYEKQADAAQDVFELVEAESKRIAHSLGFEEAQDIHVYVYDQQSVFQTKKYGWIANLLNLSWYIGDNRGTDVLLCSPADASTPHRYDEIKQAAVHEMVHAYSSILNKRMPLWINEGLALYLTNGKPPEDLYSRSYDVPSIAQTHVSNPVEFSKMGGYHFAHTYIEYLDHAFGWESILTLAKTSDYQEAFGMDEDAIHKGWIEFLKENYS